MHSNLISVAKCENFLSVSNALVAKLADALDLGSSAARRAGSTPVERTNSLKSMSYGDKSSRNKLALVLW